ncbi:hypothetical protein LIER_38797 [Lithospermum erythrorhizon]|uniref:Polygalacturonase n=1 Tax=Lithospermum erythrorhizon TaxID=34254 RepID=A0AAV3Q6T4_LITER
MHLSFDHCENVVAANLTVRAPKESPNTDGIHVTSTQNIKIQNCIVGTGDDCISIVSGSKNVQAFNIECGPGHGISIGSLGKDHAKANVSNVYVKHATLHNTTNGVRIKTWQGGLGYANNIKFEDVVMMNVTNPIIINQNYCDKEGPCQEQKNAVQVENVVYKNIRGTSASEVAMDFNCSKSIPCENIKLNSIHLIGQGVKDVKTLFVNANLTAVGDVLPPI